MIFLTSKIERGAREQKEYGGKNPSKGQRDKEEWAEGRTRRRGGGIDAPCVFRNIFLDNHPQGSLSTSLHVTVTLTMVCRQGEEMSNHPSVGTVIKLLCGSIEMSSQSDILDNLLYHFHNLSP